MELNILFLALSKAILTSLVQGLIIYMLVKLLLRFYPGISSGQRYSILYAALLLIFSGFLFAFIRACSLSSEQAGVVMTDYSFYKENSTSFLFL